MTKKITTIDDLHNTINDEFGSAKNASVMLTIANDLVTVISENEFSGIKWIAKVSSNSKYDGMKIRFTNMQTQYSEMKDILRPITLKLSNSFKVYGINIETRTKTSPGEVLEKIEFKVTLEAPKVKTLEVR